MRTCIWIPRIHVKIENWACSVAGGGSGADRDRRIPRIWWPEPLAELVSDRFNGRPCLKEWHRDVLRKHAVTTSALYMYWSMHACMCAHIQHINKLLLSLIGMCFLDPSCWLLSHLSLSLSLPHICCIPSFICLQLSISFWVCVGTSQYQIFNIRYGCFMCMEACPKLGTVHWEPEHCKEKNGIYILLFHLDPKCFCVYVHKWSFYGVHLN